MSLADLITTRALERDPEKAEEEAEAGMRKALAAERVEAWKADALYWLCGRPIGLEFTADDLVDAVGLPDVGTNRNNVIGAFMRAQSATGRIEFTGELRKSERVVRHGNLNRVWRRQA